MKKIRVCFVIHSLARGGAERVLTTIANALASQQYYEIFILVRDSSEVFYPVADSVNFVSTAEFVKSEPNNTILGRILKLYKSFKSIKPDVVISFTTTINIESIICGILTKTPVIVSERSNPKRPDIKLTWRFLRRLLYPLSYKLVCQTDSVVKYYQWLKHVSVISNPLAFSKTTKDDDLKEQIILSVGTLKPVKRVDRQIEAIYRLKHRGLLGPWKLLIVGDGQERDDLQSLIIKRGLSSNVFLCGESKDVSQYYRKAKIFLLTSDYEGMPNALMEAMQHGLACISYDCDYGPRDLVNHQNGILIKTNTIDELTHRLSDLMNNPSYLQALGSCARKSMDVYRLEVIQSSWESLIQSSLKQSDELAK